MARLAQAPRARSDQRPPTSARRPFGRIFSLIDAGVDPAKPTLGIHRGVIALAMLGVVVFLAAIALFLNGNPDSDLDLLGVGGFAVIFFTLVLGIANRAAHDQRWGGEDRTSFNEFAEDNVSIATGTISSREALIQILILPATLAFGMVAIALVFAMGW